MIIRQAQDVPLTFFQCYNTTDGEPSLKNKL